MDKDNAQAVADFEKRLENDKVLGSRQIQSQYIEAIGDVAVADKATGKVIAFVKDIDASTLTDGNSYVLLITGTAKDNGVDFNAANDNFKQQSNLSMRIWLRLSVTVVPILFIVAALIIQHKKFVITEDYYDMMLAEIEKRKQQGDGAEQQTDGNPAEDVQAAETVNPDENSQNQ